MKLAPRRRRPVSDVAVPLANVVFLLLIFVVVAGRFQALEEEGLTPPSVGADAVAGFGHGHALVVRNGRLYHRGREIAPEEVAAWARSERVRLGDRPLELLIDRGENAGRLIALVTDLNAAGLPAIDLVTVPDGGR